MIGYYLPWLLAALLLWLGVVGGDHFVRWVLRRAGRGNGLGPVVDADARLGRLIGRLERLLLMLLVAMGQWEAVGFLLAAKSVARFRELDDKTFSDYYLIGTLASLLAAVVCGGAIRLVLRVML